MFEKWKKTWFNYHIERALKSPTLDNIYTLTTKYTHHQDITYDVFKASSLYVYTHYGNVEEFLTHLQEFINLVVDRKYIRLELKRDLKQHISIDDYLTNHDNHPVDFYSVIEAINNEIERFTMTSDTLSKTQYTYYNRQAQPLFEEIIRIIEWTWSFR